MRPERKIRVQKGEYVFEWGPEDWLGIVITLVLLLGSVFAWYGDYTASLMVFSFGGGYGLHEIISRVNRARAALGRKRKVRRYGRKPRG